MAKPTALPRWADVGGPSINPVSGKKDNGFANNEEPPAGILNWLLNNIYTWIQWMSAGPLSGNRRVLAGTGWETTGSGGLRGAEGTFVPNAASDVFLIPFEVHAGEVLDSVTLRCLDAAATTVTLDVRTATDGAGGSSLGSAASSNSGVAQDVTVSGLSQTVSGTTGVVYFARITFAWASAPPTLYHLDINLA